MDELKAKVRASKDNYYLDIAEAVGEKSTCLRRHYGAVIVKNDEIISTGYNGSPRGCINCTDDACMRNELGFAKGRGYNICGAVHAEMNAVISAARRDMIGATIYIVGREVFGNQKYAVNTTSCPATAVDETEAVNVAVWPNPATDAVNVIADKAISKITVINLAGGIEFATDGSQVNIGGLAPSLYFLEISFEDGSKIVEKILKK